MKTILSIASARPNFVKLAAVHHAIKETFGDEVSHVIVHTGQHYDPFLSDVFFQQLKIPDPAFNLGVHGGTREEVIEATKQELLKKLPLINPDIVFVYGDVNGALGAAEAAKEAGIPLAHIEAGLRSFDLSMPEEHNRMGIDRIANLLFCTEQSGVDHLKKEGAEGKVFLVGNTMIDTLVRMLPETGKEELPFGLPENFAVATLHRPSNVDDINGLLQIVAFLGQVDKIVPIVLPMHPRFRAVITKPDPERTTVPLLSISKPIDPLGYIAFLKLMRGSKFIITDSGGIQEEAVLLGKRCFTLRPNTERPSTIESGSNVLITDIEDSAQREAILDYAKNPIPPAIEIPAEWDGHAGERIIRETLAFLSNR
jgi:UDP-N-acetylglucosamine 2-epimerase (non-hydrolysing)